MKTPALQTNTIRLLSRSERDALKKDYSKFKKWNKLWNDSGMSSTQLTGSRMELIAQSRAETEEDWHRFYLTNQMTTDQIEKHAAKWAYLTGLPDEVALAHVVIHLLDETWVGWQRENEVLDFLNQSDLFNGTAFRPAYEWDTKYAIDLAVMDEDSAHGFTLCFQVKSPSFFASDSLGWNKKKIQGLHKGAEKLGLTPFLINWEDILKRGFYNPIHWSNL